MLTAVARTPLGPKVMDNFRFPILSKDYIDNRLNEIKNSDRIRERLTSLNKTFSYNKYDQLKS